jgi:hypothetical protein
LRKGRGFQEEKDGRKVETHPMKFGKMVHARAEVRIGLFVFNASAMPGKAVKKGPFRSRSRVMEGQREQLFKTGEGEGGTFPGCS